ncbi:MAG TPA: hypothetical protein VIK61_17320, partial [Acidimicrobiia bacterium]
MGTVELEHDWLVHQRRMAEELPALVKDARAAAAAEAGTIAAWREHLARTLVVVGTALQAHVAADEHPEGFLPSSERRAPRLIHALEELRAEHRALISEVAEAESVVSHARVAEDAPAAVRAVESVLDRIEHHLHTA